MENMEQVYQDYYSAVFFYALSLSKNVHEAEEITSETFYRALISSMEVKEGLRFWLFRVCKNLWLDEVRRRKRFSMAQEGSVEDEALSKLIQKEENYRLYGALLTLPPRYREYLYLFYFARHRIREIAALTGETEGAVKTGLSRARAALRKRLKEEER